MFSHACFVFETRRHVFILYSLYILCLSICNNSDGGGGVNKVCFVDLVVLSCNVFRVLSTLICVERGTATTERLALRPPISGSFLFSNFIHKMQHHHFHSSLMLLGNCCTKKKGGGGVCELLHIFILVEGTNSPIHPSICYRCLLLTCVHCWAAYFCIYSHLAIKPLNCPLMAACSSAQVICQL